MTAWGETRSYSGVGSMSGSLPRADLGTSSPQDLEVPAPHSTGGRLRIHAIMALMSSSVMVL